MVRYAVRIHLPDRPGAPGAVARRIGAVGGDIIAIDILDRADGQAMDEFIIELAGEELVGLLRSEILEVDGASIDTVRAVDPQSS